MIFLIRYMDKVTYTAAVRCSESLYRKLSFREENVYPGDGLAFIKEAGFYPGSVYVAMREEVIDVPEGFLKFAQVPAYPGA